MSVHFCSCTCMVCQPTVAYMQSKLFWQSTGSFLKYDLTSVLIVVIIRGTGMWTEKEMMNKAQVSYLTEEKTRMKGCTQGTVCLLLCTLSYIQWHQKNETWEWEDTENSETYTQQVPVTLQKCCLSSKLVCSCLCTLYWCFQLRWEMWIQWFCLWLTCFLWF